MDAQAERRSEPRTITTAPVKLFDERARRYRPARTIDVSTGGALIEVAGGMSLHPGDRVDLAVDLHDRLPVVRQEDLVPAIVVRTQDASATTRTVGIRFVQRQAIALAA